MKYFIPLALLLTLLAACTPSSSSMTELPTASPAVIEMTPTPKAFATLSWWRDAVFYEIFVRSFNDSDGDGIGDFDGITQKLDYLQSLGVTALWLMPIHPSPSYHGYDVLNYYTVNPQYGTMTDFKRLLDEAHGRGMRVIIDLVLNHTSSGHPFFQSARNPNSPYRNYYVWSDTDLDQTGAYGGNAWHETENGFYYGLFSSRMPDLNYLNSEVTTQMENVVRFWLTDVGVDGFRLDAIKHLIEQGGKQENTPATHEWLKGFYLFYKGVDSEAYTVGEVFDAGGTLIKAYGGGQDQMDHIFNFELASGYINSANGRANSGVISAMKFTLIGAADGNYAAFLTNHDQERVMSELNGDVNKAKVAASLLLTGPGTPYLYYGEEIGMTGQKPDEFIRTPMQWGTGKNAGFTTGKPWQTINADYTMVNVAAQENDPASLLNHYQALISLRKGHAALRTGKVVLLQTGNAAVYAILRVNGDEMLLVLVNLGKEKISAYKLSLPDSLLPNGTFTPQTLFGNGQATSLAISGGKFGGYIPLVELAPYTTYVFRLK